MATQTSIAGTPTKVAPEPPRSTILLVDDRSADLEAMQAVLEHNNLNILRATSGEEALRLLLAQDISVVLIDVNMPAMNGYEVAHWMRRTEKTRRIPILFISGGMEDELAALRGYLSGALDYLTKPVNPAVLRAKVDRLLDLDRQRRGLEYAYRSLEAQESFISSILSATGEGMIGLDLDGRIIFVNPAASRYLGVDTQQLIGQYYTAFFSSHERGADDWRNTPFYRAWTERQDVRDEAEFVRRDEGTFPVSFCCSPLPEPQPGVTLVFQDISEQKALEARLRQRASTDPLTGLGNRDALKNALNVSLARAARHYRSIAVMFIDLDNFKQINDTHGHEAGDSLLRTVAHRLSQSVRVTDTVCRLGGDEFTIILDEIDDASDAAHTADKILSALTSPFEIDGIELPLTASIGIATYPESGHDAASLMQAADMAMYRAKSEGRNLYQFYTPDMNARAKSRVILEQRLKHAFEHNEFEVLYQPQIHLESQRVAGFETLLRWRPSAGDGMSPSLFIPMLEETGLISAVGAQSIGKALRQCREWGDRDMPLAGCRLAINLSARQFLDPQLLDVLDRAIAQNGLPPGMIEVEVTESTLMQDTAQTERVVTRLKDMGVRVSIDDFGAGYASLAYLKRFPFDTLKIDRTFIRNIAGDVREAAVVESVIQLAHKLGFESIAEGVETREQLVALRRMGCDYAQGHVLSRPLAAEAIAAFVAGWKGVTEPDMPGADKQRK